MDNGWVKLHRQIMDSSLWTLTDGQFRVAITILLSANHKERGWLWKGQEFRCQPGQLITSLDSLAKRSNESVQTVRTALKNLETIGFLRSESTKRGRLITVLNWEKYQNDDRFERQNPQKLTNKKDHSNVEISTFMGFENEQANKQLTNNQQTINKQSTNNQQTANKQLTTNKNVIKKECNKERMKESSRSSMGYNNPMCNASVDQTATTHEINQKVYEHYEKCGFPINGYTVDDVDELIAKFGATWCMEAMTRAKDRGKTTRGYLKAILNSWKAGGGIDAAGAASKKNSNPHVYDYDNDDDDW